jgi:hypothetical protein
MMKWRLLSPSAQLMVDPASGARGIIRDTCADGAYRFHWSVIPWEEALPIAAGRTGGLARAQSIAEEALRAYAEDWLGVLVDETEAVVSKPLITPGSGVLTSEILVSRKFPCRVSQLTCSLDDLADDQ